MARSTIAWNGAMHRKAGRGLLLVMIEVTRGNEEELDRWYEQEHVPDRAGCPGFLSARRFHNLREGDEARYLALYDLEEPGVLQTEAYNRIFMTPWTEKIRTFYERPSIRSVYVEVAPLAAHSRKDEPDTIARTADRGLMLELVDVAVEQEGRLDLFYETEHLPAWRDTAGFLAVRRFVKMEGAGARWLALYDLDRHPDMERTPSAKLDQFMAGREGNASHRIYQEIPPPALR